MAKGMNGWTNTAIYQCMGDFSAEWMDTAIIGWIDNSN